MTLDYTYYPGEDLYSDGPVEEELLEIAKHYREEELNDVIAQRKSWPVLYHFSHVRKNVLEWLPITKEDKVLEIWLRLRSSHRRSCGKSRLSYLH